MGTTMELGAWLEAHADDRLMDAEWTVWTGSELLAELRTVYGGVGLETPMEEAHGVAAALGSGDALESLGPDSLLALIQRPGQGGWEEARDRMVGRAYEMGLIWKRAPEGA